MTGVDILLDEPGPDRQRCKECGKPVPICCGKRDVCCTCYDEIMKYVWSE